MNFAGYKEKDINIFMGADSSEKCYGSYVYDNVYGFFHGTPTRKIIDDCKT